MNPLKNPILTNGHQKPQTPIPHGRSGPISRPNTYSLSQPNPLPQTASHLNSRFPKYTVITNGLTDRTKTELDLDQ